MLSSNPVPRLYRTVVDEVVKNVRESFLNEGVDEQVLLELKQLWESKLLQSRAIDFMPADASVRMNLTYPLTLPVSHEQVRGEKVTVAGQLVTNNPTAGQMVYVSHHPTLANVQQLSAPAAQAALAIQGTSHDAGASSSHSAGHHTTVTSVHQIQNTLPQQSQQQLEQQLQHYQQLQRKHQIQQQQQQQQIEHRQIQPQGTIIQHTLQHAQQHNQNAQRHQQQIQQSTGIQVLSGEPATTIFGVTPNNRGPRVIYTQPVQPQQQSQQQQRIISSKQIIQVDGANDSSSDDDDEDENFDDYDDYPIGAEQRDENEADNLDDDEDTEPLNTDDDISDDDPTDLFDTENVVVCQYDKIARSKNKWKFYLKDGIMNLRSKDYVFHKANGESEW